MCVTRATCVKTGPKKVTVDDEKQTFYFLKEHFVFLTHFHCVHCVSVCYTSSGLLSTCPSGPVIPIWSIRACSYRTQNKKKPISCSVYRDTALLLLSSMVYKLEQMESDLWNDGLFLSVRCGTRTVIWPARFGHTQTSVGIFLNLCTCADIFSWSEEMNVSDGGWRSS